MLKKVAFVLALTVLVSFALAAESGPSNTVGFTKVACPAGAYTPFGLAFEFWDVVSGVPTYGTSSGLPSDVIGDQMTVGTYTTADRLYRQGGAWCFRGNAAHPYWLGGLESAPGMETGYAYKVYNRQAGAQDLVLAGEVDTSTYAAPTVVASGDTPLSFRDARVRPVANINLITSGFKGGGYLDSDRFYEQGGSWCWYNTGTSSWVGALTQVTPAKAYRIREKHATSWTYNYGPGTVAPPPERPGGRDAGMDRLNRPVRPSRSVR